VLSQDAIYELVERHRYRVLKQLGEDGEDVLQDSYLAAHQALERYAILDPAGYVAAIVRNKIAKAVERRIRERDDWEHAEELCDRDEEDLLGSLPWTGLNPEQELLFLECIKRAVNVLEQLHPRYRELLVRFYRDGQPAARIRRAMKLTPHQFKIAKSRARIQAVERYRAASLPAL
jgi:RNA polymerase sigma factor (sigma-70 family)